MVGALLTLVVGVWLIAFPLSATIGLTFLLAWWFFGSGVLLLYEAWWLRDIPGVAPPIVIHGVLSLVLGVLLLLDLPSSANWALGVLVGVNLLLWGARALAAARALDRALKTP
jgi:uncharacterized membrane protein HdeD (DUF308 family)